MAVYVTVKKTTSGIIAKPTPSLSDRKAQLRRNKSAVERRKAELAEQDIVISKGDKTYTGKVVDDKVIGVRTVTKEEQQQRETDKAIQQNRERLMVATPKTQAEIIASETAKRGSLGVYSNVPLSQETEIRAKENEISSTYTAAKQTENIFGKLRKSGEKDIQKTQKISTQSPTDWNYSISQYFGRASGETKIYFADLGEGFSQTIRDPKTFIVSAGLLALTKNPTVTGAAITGGLGATYLTTELKSIGEKKTTIGKTSGSLLAYGVASKTLAKTAFNPEFRKAVNLKYQKVKSSISASMFKAQLKSKGLSFSEWQQIKVTQQLQKITLKDAVSTQSKSIYPERTVIEIGQTKSGQPVVTSVKKVNWLEIGKKGSYRGGLLLEQISTPITVVKPKVTTKIKSQYIPSFRRMSYKGTAAKVSSITTESPSAIFPLFSFNNQMTDTVQKSRSEIIFKPKDIFAEESITAQTITPIYDVTVVQKPKQEAAQQQRQSTALATAQVPIYSQINKQVYDTVKTNDIIPKTPVSPSTKPKTEPSAPIVPQLPDLFNLRKLKFKSQFSPTISKRVKFKSKYVPSLEAEVFKIRGQRSRFAEISGIGLRAITKTGGI